MSGRVHLWVAGAEAAGGYGGWGYALVRGDEASGVAGGARRTTATAMALTGLILVGFVVGHLVGNLQIFQDPDHINGYAAFLHQMGPLLWVARIVLLISVGIHIWAATALALENKQARTGNGPATAKHWIQATLSSRFVRWTGYVVLAFVIYHLAQFTLGVAGSAQFKENLPRYVMAADYRVAGFPVIKAGAEVLDVHSMVILGFQNPIVSVFYIVAVGLLSSVFPVLLASSGVPAVGLILIAFLVVALLIGAIWTPRTQGKSLRQIEAERYGAAPLSPAREREDARA